MQKTLCPTEADLDGPFSPYHPLLIAEHPFAPYLLHDALHAPAQLRAPLGALLGPGAALPDLLHDLLEVERCEARGSEQRCVKHGVQDESEPAPRPWRPLGPRGAGRPVAGALLGFLGRLILG